jgi:hypothetical protein
MPELEQVDTNEAKRPVESFAFELSHSKSKILEKLDDRIRNYKFDVFATELSPNYIHYPSFKIEQERITVKRPRSTPIYIYLEAIAGGKTKLRVEQEKLTSRTNAVLMIFSVIMFGLLFYINLTSGTSIGVALAVTLIPLAAWVLILLSLFYLMGRLRKHFFKKFANKIARHLEAA